MLLANPRNTILFAGGFLALTIALFDDSAPARLTDSADAVARRRVGETAAAQVSPMDFAVEGGVWESAAAATNEGIGSGIRDVEPIVVPAPAPPSTLIEGPAAPVPAVISNQPVPGLRERSAPLDSSYADDGSRNMAEDLRRALG